VAVTTPIGGEAAPGPARAGAYGWAVLALSFGLLMSDYMARQVLNAVNPLLKAEWDLSDAKVAALSSVVALAVGLLTFPLSLAADRLGRVRSLTAMAALWSMATLWGAWAGSYGEMFAARLLVGVGEAAYGSVGLAVVLAVFPVAMRSTLVSLFLAGSMLGQVLGVALGGQIAAAHGWRTAFEAIGMAGLVLAALYPLVVRESRLGTRPPREPLDPRRLGRQLFGKPVLLLTYFASGAQLFAASTLAVWLPSLFTRYYAMPIDRAGQTTALYLIVAATGMVACGMASDRLARRRPEIKPVLAMAFALASATLFAITFLTPPGTLQMLALGGALFVMTGVAGVAGAMVANLTPQPIHGTAMATLALANNLIGLAPGPLVTGWLADRIGLIDALMVLPVPCALCAIAMALARPGYTRELARQTP